MGGGQNYGFVFAAPLGMAAPAPRGRPAGTPVWFDKMDKNNDGDVSPREWLGTDEEFKAIDADRDGLIAPTRRSSSRPRRTRRNSCEGGLPRDLKSPSHAKHPPRPSPSRHCSAWPCSAPPPPRRRRPSASRRPTRLPVPRQRPARPTPPPRPRRWASRPLRRGLGRVHGQAVRLVRQGQRRLPLVRRRRPACAERQHRSSTSHGGRSAQDGGPACRSPRSTPTRTARSRRRSSARLLQERRVLPASSSHQQLPGDDREADSTNPSTSASTSPAAAPSRRQGRPGCTRSSGARVDENEDEMLDRSELNTRINSENLRTGRGLLLRSMAVQRGRADPARHPSPVRRPGRSKQMMDKYDTQQGRPADAGRGRPVKANCSPSSTPTRTAARTPANCEPTWPRRRTSSSGFQLGTPGTRAARASSAGSGSPRR